MLRRIRFPCITYHLEKNAVLLTIYAGVATFFTYSCMYAFRKPFTAATFQQTEMFSVGYKTLLVIAQLLGYTLSKFIGIKWIAELRSEHRAAGIILLIFIAWIALLLFAILPPAAGVVCMFLNGIPLGLIWGIVFSYLEGRRTTEMMGAVLTVSFIFSSGVVKSVGKWLMINCSVSEMAMPFVTGAVFIFPLIVFVVLLEQIPHPSREDKALRWERVPMSAVQRRDFLKHFLPGIVLLVVTYVFLTVLRDIRDNFAADIWQENGYGKAPAIFTFSEIPASVLILFMMSLLVLIQDNYEALKINFILITLGWVISLLSTLLFRSSALSPVIWMMLTGIGLYMGYVPFNCMLFERLIAVFRRPSNVGFLMYVADSFGYLGSIAVLLFREFFKVPMSWTHFFQHALLVASIAGTVLIAASYVYFSWRYKKTVKLDEGDKLIEEKSSVYKI
ncbi:MAG: DUF5690 family protein [Chitinophagales bacterium]|nr:DUF5690 family protein [Chitinophagales bacterium]